MNEWRRSLLAAYSVLLVGLAVLLIVLAWSEGRQLDLDLGSFRFVSFVDAGETDRILFTGLMFFIAWFALISLAIAVVPERRRYRDRLTIHAQGGEMTITADMVATMIREEIERLPSVRQAFVSVRFVDDAVEPDLTLVLAPGTDVTHVVNAARLTAVHTMQDRFGVRVLPAGVSLASGTPPGHDAPYEPPPPPLAVRRVVRPNDGNLEFPADDRV